MTEEEMRALKPGDHVKNTSGYMCYIVTANYGDRVTAVRTVDLTNPREWIRIEPEFDIVDDNP